MRFLWVMLLSSSLFGCAVHKPSVPAPEKPSEAVKAPVVEEVKPPLATTPPAEAVAAVHYRQQDWTALPGWPGDQLQLSWSAWLQSCQRLAGKPDWQAICAEAAALGEQDDDHLRQFFETRFTPWRMETGAGVQTGLITGYYEALLQGGRKAGPGRVPLYGVPSDLLTLDLGAVYPETKGLRLRGRLEGKTVKPYWSRQEIDAGKPANAPVLAWADDAIDAFFLQVQGSGRVELDDGSVMRLGYADQNGHPYHSIGKWLVEQGELSIERASMQGIRAWAEAHPERVQELLNANPSYVFFRLMAATEGVLGALNVPLTAGASVAVDKRYIPLGSPVYLATTRPDDQQPLQRLMQAQDTGGAIRGPVRADFYWGFGHEAAELAGIMKQQGQLWLLWPNGLALPQ